MRLISALLLAPVLFGETPGPGMVEEFRAAGLDSQACFRVRDLQFSKDEARFYLNEGLIVFRKPVNGVRTAAVFSAEVEGGDGEVLLMPPTRGERLSLSRFIGTPNLAEPFKTVLFLFTDSTGDDLYAKLTAADAKREVEEGLLLAARWDPVLRNISGSLEVRLLEDLFSPDRARNGLFFAGIAGQNLAGFDLIFDPRGSEQLTLASMTSRDGHAYYDIWSQFAARSFRNGQRKPAPLPFRLSDYRIGARIDPLLHMTVETRVRLTPNVGGLSALAFEISPSMKVTGATLDGADVELIQRESLRANLARGGENRRFLVMPSHALDAGRDYEIVFRHEGDVIRNAGNNVFFVSSRSTWYPQSGIQFASFDLTFRFPKALKLIATGEPVGEMEGHVEGEDRIVRRKTTAPARLAGFNLGDYMRFSVAQHGYRVDVYANRRLEAMLENRSPPSFVSPVSPPQTQRGGRRPSDTLPPIPPPGPAERAQKLASDIAADYFWMASKFGAPPSKTLSVSPIPGRFGQGFPGLIYLSTLSYLGTAPRAFAPQSGAQLFFSELLSAHEAAHQWWGNVVTAAGYQDEWLQEALANYTALLCLERRRGTKAIDQVLQEYRNRLIEKGPVDDAVESAGPIVWGTRLDTSANPAAWRAIVYDKGTWIVHMLRRRLGDTQFFAMLSAMTERFRFQPISTAQFRDIAQEFLNKRPADQKPPRASSLQQLDPKLDNFFDTWVYGIGVPALRLTASVKGTKITGTLFQSEVADDFSADVPVEVQLANKKSFTFWLRTGDEPVNFSVTAPSIATKVVLDPGNATLRR